MAGREGLIDSTVKTAETGYAQRKLVKSLEDIMVKYDGTIRLSNNKIVQIIYGDSGADSTKQYNYKVKIIGYSNSDIKENLIFSKKELDSIKFSKDKNEKLYNYLIEIRDEIREILLHASMDYRTIIQELMFPVNFNRIISNSLNIKEKSKKVLDNPEYILDSINKVINNVLLICKHTKDNSLKTKDEIISKKILNIILFDVLAPKKVIFKYKFSKKVFDNIINSIYNDYNNNIIEPGEMVGVISAQAMGEPLTQMTLNTFHHSGIGTMSHTTVGVPRIKELLSVSKNIKTPQMKIYLSGENKFNSDIANKIASHIKDTKIKDIRNRLDVYYDNTPNSKDSFMKKDNIDFSFYTKKVNKIDNSHNINNLPWLIRIELLREKMIEKEVTLLEIKSKFSNWWEEKSIDSKNMKKEHKRVIQKIMSVSILSNSDNDEVPVIHIRFNIKDINSETDPFNSETLNYFIDEIIDNFRLKGINDIADINSVGTDRITTIDDDGGLVLKEENIIYTSGVNLEDIRYLYGIDLNRTIANDINEVYKIFGIEITRNVLLHELQIAYDSQGHGVNYQHLSLIVDLMTSDGYLMSIDRHGLYKTDIEPLVKASFEKSVDQFLNAAVFHETDNMEGVSSRIMAGLVIKGGTGYPTIKLDTNMIENMEYDESSVKDNVEILTDGIASDIISNKKGKTDLFIPDF